MLAQPSPAQALPASPRKACSAARRFKPGRPRTHALRGRQVSRQRCRLPLPAACSVFLEEDKGCEYDVLAASGVGGRGRVDTGRMETPARDGVVGDGVIGLEHRDLGGLLLRKPVPLMVGKIAADHMDKIRYRLANAAVN